MYLCVCMVNWVANSKSNMVCRKTEVMNLLESAGFSRSNPYYVVQQGKVGCFCLFKFCYYQLNLLLVVLGSLSNFSVLVSR